MSAVVAVLSIACWLAPTATPLHLDARDPVMPLLGHADVLVDVDGRETIASVQQRTDFITPHDEPSLGMGHAVFWARFVVADVTDIAGTDSWSLRARFPRPHDIELFTVDEHGDVVAHWRTGLLVPRASKPIDGDSAMMLPLAVPRGTHWVRVEVEPARMAIDIGSDRAFAVARHDEGLFAGVYYGVFVGLFFFNLLFGLATRDVTHALYCLFLVCIALQMGVRDGWLPDEMPRALFLGAGMTLTSLASTSFARRFLNVTSSSSPKLARAFSFGLWTALAATVPPLFGVPFAVPSMLITLANIVVMVVAAVHVSRRGSRPAQLFLLAWAALVISVVLAILHALHVIDAPWTTTVGVRVGATAEMILLALALAARVGELREEKERAELALKDEVLARNDAVSRTMIEAQDAERLRFARDLHDGLGHSLLLIKQRATHHAPDLADDVQHAIDDARAIARAIMPARLDSAGLADALRTLADSHAAATGADVDVIIDDETAQRATHLGARSVHVFRIAQEAMTNATKHGGADHVLVTLRADDHGAVLSVVDNGRGFGVADSGERSVVTDVDGGGVGLVGMRQRARMLDGSLTVGPRDDGKRGVAVILKLDPQTIGQPS